MNKQQMFATTKANAAIVTLSQTFGVGNANHLIRSRGKQPRVHLLGCAELRVVDGTDDDREHARNMLHEGRIRSRDCCDRFAVAAGPTAAPWAFWHFL